MVGEEVIGFRSRSLRRLAVNTRPSGFEEEKPERVIPSIGEG